MHRRPSTPAFLRSAALAVAVLISACSSVDKPVAPEPESDFIVHDSLHAAEKVDAPALARMASYVGPDGQLVYLHMAPCCDQYNKVYNADGRYLCAPSGGFTGLGDGRCPAWVHQLRPRPSAMAASNPWPVTGSL